LFVLASRHLHALLFIKQVVKCNALYPGSLFYVATIVCSTPPPLCHVWLWFSEKAALMQQMI